MHTKEKLPSLLFISLHRKLFPEKIIHHGSIQFLARDEDFISQRKRVVEFLNQFAKCFIVLKFKKRRYLGGMAVDLL